MRLRLFCTTILLLLLMSNPVGAVRPMDAELVKEAQEFGRVHIDSPLKDFLQPWTVVEEKSDPLSDKAEIARLYTPFLLIAADARDKMINGGTVNIADSQKILADYAGYITLSVLLYGAEPNFIQDAYAVITQGGKIIKAVQFQMPTVAQRSIYPSDADADADANAFVAQGYLYFQDTDISVDNTALLTVVTGDKREHRYYLDLEKLR
jgi:hypothetical protein